MKVIAVGAISSYDDVNSILLAGRADLCALGRTHLYDPNWTLHAAAEQEYVGPGAEWPRQWAAGRRRPPTSRTDKVPPRLPAAARGGGRPGPRPLDARGHGAHVTVGNPAVQPPQPPSRQSRSTVVTFLGAVVRPLGSWMPIAGTVDLLTQAGLDAPSVRTAVHRLKGNGWLQSEAREGARGYALTTTALETLAAGDEVIWHARTPADVTDGWCIVHFGVPESMRAKRHQLRAHLSSLGFGNVGTALWIAPARMRTAAERAVTELGLEAHTADLRR